MTGFPPLSSDASARRLTDNGLPIEQMGAIAGIGGETAERGDHPTLNGRGAELVSLEAGLKGPEGVAVQALVTLSGWPWRRKYKTSI